MAQDKILLFSWLTGKDTLRLADFTGRGPAGREKGEGGVRTTEPDMSILVRFV